MVKNILDYAATVWSPHTQKDITIERSQRKAARFVFNNFLPMPVFYKCQLTLTGQHLLPAEQSKSQLWCSKKFTTLLTFQQVLTYHLLQLFIIQEATIEWQELILIYNHFFHPQSKSEILYPSTWLTLRTLINYSKDHSWSSNIV